MAPELAPRQVDGGLQDWYPRAGPSGLHDHHGYHGRQAGGLPPGQHPLAVAPGPHDHLGHQVRGPDYGAEAPAAVPPPHALLGPREGRCGPAKYTPAVEYFPHAGGFLHGVSPDGLRTPPSAVPGQPPGGGEPGVLMCASGFAQPLVAAAANRDDEGMWGRTDGEIAKLQLAVFVNGVQSTFSVEQYVALLRSKLQFRRLQPKVTAVLSTVSVNQVNLAAFWPCNRL